MTVPSDPMDVTAEVVEEIHEEFFKDTDLGASKPVPVDKPEPKRTVEHSIVKACGHSIDLRHPPTQANCEDCWTAFFTLAVDTPSIHKILVAQGRVGLVAIVGKKFVKYFGKFLQQQLRAPVEVPQVEPSIEGSVLDVGAEREASLGITNLKRESETIQQEV